MRKETRRTGNWVENQCVSRSSCMHWWRKIKESKRRRRRRREEFSLGFMILLSILFCDFTIDPLKHVLYFCVCFFFLFLYQLFNRKMYWMQQLLFLLWDLTSIIKLDNRPDYAWLACCNISKRKTSEQDSFNIIILLYTRSMHSSLFLFLIIN